MIIFCSLEIRGVENIENIKGNVIIASNHTSELDPLMTVAALPFFSHHLPLVFVSREKSFYINSRFNFAYGGKFFKLMGALPAYAGLNNYEKALPNHLAVARKGKTICIFPIGKKHTFNDLGKARGGVSYLAEKTSLPIVPVALNGLAGQKFSDMLKGKCQVTIIFGEPVKAVNLFSQKSRTKVSKDSNKYEKAAVVLMERIAAL